MRRALIAFVKTNYLNLKLESMSVSNWSLSLHYKNSSLIVQIALARPTHNSNFTKANMMDFFDLDGLKHMQMFFFQITNGICVIYWIPYLVQKNSIFPWTKPSLKIRYVFLLDLFVSHFGQNSYRLWLLHLQMISCRKLFLKLWRLRAVQYFGGTIAYPSWLSHKIDFSFATAISVLTRPLVPG